MCEYGLRASKVHSGPSWNFLPYLFFVPSYYIVSATQCTHVRISVIYLHQCPCVQTTLFAVLSQILDGHFLIWWEHWVFLWKMTSFWHFPSVHWHWLTEGSAQTLTSVVTSGANYTNRLKLSHLSLCIRFKPQNRLKSVSEIGPYCFLCINSFQGHWHGHWHGWNEKVWHPL